MSWQEVHSYSAYFYSKRIDQFVAADGIDVMVNVTLEKLQIDRGVISPVNISTVYLLCTAHALKRATL